MRYDSVEVVTLGGLGTTGGVEPIRGAEGDAAEEIEVHISGDLAGGVSYDECSTKGLLLIGNHQSNDG